MRAGRRGRGSVCSSPYCCRSCPANQPKIAAVCHSPHEITVFSFVAACATGGRPTRSSWAGRGDGCPRARQAHADLISAFPNARRAAQGPNSADGQPLRQPQRSSAAAGAGALPNPSTDQLALRHGSRRRLRRREPLRGGPGGAPPPQRARGRPGRRAAGGAGTSRVPRPRAETPPVQASELQQLLGRVRGARARGGDEDRSAAAQAPCAVRAAASTGGPRGATPTKARAGTSTATRARRSKRGRRCGRDGGARDGRRPRARGERRRGRRRRDGRGRRRGPPRGAPPRSRAPRSRGRRFGMRPTPPRRSRRTPSRPRGPFARCRRRDRRGRGPPRPTWPARDPGCGRRDGRVRR